ncbi:MAG: thymidylate kinase, partial [Alphaproteobacteria bacterium]
HLKRTILPALGAGKWVISDRYADSTFAYQGAGHGLGAAVIQDIHRIATDDFWPHMTILLDIEPEAGLGRANVREAALSEDSREDRFERMTGNYHHRLRQAFLSIAQQNSERFRVISAAGSVGEVAGRIWQQVAMTFGLDHGR